MENHKEFKLEDIDEESSNIQTILTIIAVLVAVAGFIALSWYAYNSYKDNLNSNIPLISADNKQRKITPSDKGGMKIADMDKQVYAQLSKDHANIAKVERILPPAEEPLKKQDIVSQYQEDESNKNIVISKKAEAIDDISNGGNIITSNKEAIASNNIEENIGNKKELADISMNVNSDYKEQAIKNIPRGSKFDESEYKEKNHGKSYRVQISSYKSHADAEKGWESSINHTGGLVSKYDHFIEKKMLPSKGMVFRLQIGNFEDEKAAIDLCKQLKNINTDCFIVRP